MIKKIISVLASIMPNFLKINLYRLIGYEIGKNTKIGFMTLILGNKVKIGNNVKIGSLNIFKMNNLLIGNDSTIRSLNMMIGPKNLFIGKRVQIVGPFTFMNLAEDIILEDGSGVGSHSIFYTHGVYLPYTEGHPRKFGKIRLGKKVWSPTHVIFLPGVTIGDDSIIAAGSIVNKSFPENSFISGNPANRITKASNLKMKMNKDRLKERMRQIIYDFKEDNLIENSKIICHKDAIEIKKGKKLSLIKLYFKGNLDKINLSKYDQIVIFGENLHKTNNKKISLFDIKNRRKILRGKLSKAFFKHLERYGEYFD